MENQYLFWVAFIFVFIGGIIARNKWDKHRESKDVIKKDLNRINSAISFKESIDLTDLPIITFINNNTKLNMLLDTGAVNSVINSSVIEMLEYDSTNQTGSIVDASGNESDRLEVVEMSVGYKEYQFKTFYLVRNMDDVFGLIKQESGVTVHGILGSRFFQEYGYILDFSTLSAYINK